MQTVQKLIFFSSLALSPYVIAVDDTKTALDSFTTNIGSVSSAAYVVGGVALGILAFIMAIKFIKGMVYS